MSVQSKHGYQFAVVHTRHSCYRASQGELTVTYEGIGGDTNPLESGISWQAAVLEEVNNISRPGGLPGQGGVSLQAIKASMQP